MCTLLAEPNPLTHSEAGSSGCLMAMLHEFVHRSGSFEREPVHNLTYNLTWPVAEVCRRRPSKSSRRVHR